MLHKQHRLAKTREVEYTLKRGRSFFNPYFVVKYQRTSGPARFTVIVSTKVSKKSVIRNRLKRLIRETIRLRLGSFKPGEYVIIIKPGATKSTSSNFRDSFVKLIQSVHLINS